MESHFLGCVGDQPLHVITKTRKREIVYGNTPQPAKMEQFKELADKCRVSEVELARKIIAMTWEEKMEFIAQQFSTDKQVLKVLKMAEDKNDDKGLEPKRRKHFTEIAERNEETSIPQVTSEDRKETLVEPSSEVKIADNEKKPVQVPIKPAPEGSFYKKRFDFTQSLSRKYSSADTAVTRTKVQSQDSDTLDSIFSDPAITLPMSSKRSPLLYEIRDCDETLDDIFKD